MILSRMNSKLKKKRIVSFFLMTILFGIVSTILWLIPMPAINVYLKAETTSADITSKVVFKFDVDEVYDGSSEQSAYPENYVASIRFDPLNEKAKALSITVPGEKSGLKELRAETQVSDDRWFTAYSISGTELSLTRDQEGNASIYTVKQNQLDEMYSQIHKKSLEKPLAQIAFLLVYLFMCSRKFLFHSTDAKLFYGVALTIVMIVCFTVNLWVVKPDIASTNPGKLDSNDVEMSVSYSDFSSLTSADKFTVQQEFPLDAGEINSVSLQVNVENNVSPTDTANSNYHDVYVSKNEFVDKYLLTIADKDEILYTSIVSPKLLNENLDAITVLLKLSNCKGETLRVRLDKTWEGEPSSLTFQLGTPSKALPNLALISEEPSLVAYETDTSIEGVLLQSKNMVVSTSYASVPYKLVATVILYGAIALILLNCGLSSAVSKRFRSVVCIFDYVIVGLYACAQPVFYRSYIGGFPDEKAHISYMSYLVKNAPYERIIPDFSCMRVYANIDNNVMDYANPTQFNYLGHPPFYYHILRLLSHSVVDGNQVIYDLQLMRNLSFAIGFSGILIAFYIGYTRLRRIPILHMLYGLILISAPNMIYVISGVSNDALTMPAVAIFMLGIIRFYEKKYNILTYFVIAAGINLSLLSKLTTGMIVCIIALGIVLFTFFKEKKIKSIINWRFFITLPLYGVSVIYFWKVYKRFHTIQPNYKALAEQEFVQSGMYRDINSRGQMGVWEYLCYFFQKFMGTWDTLAGHTYLPRENSTLSSHLGLSSIALTAILVMPFILFLVSASKEVWYLRISVMSIVITFTYQMLNSGFMSFNVNGYPGGISSRYYLCAVPLLAYAIMKLIENNLHKSDDISMRASFRAAHRTMLSTNGIALCAVFALLLVVDGFIYSVLMNLPECSFFYVISH